jgi:hypothetical protein
MEIHFKIIGVLQIFLALIHIPFPTYFNWKQELKSLSLINRQIMIVHTIFIALIVFLIGILSIFKSDELIYNPFGKIISLGIGFFWFVRLLIQFFGYSSSLWKGKRFETFIHLLFSFMWIYFSSVYLWNGINS